MTVGINVGGHAPASGEKLIELAPRLDVHGAITMKRELAALLDGTSSVCINAESATRVSTAACQVLVAFVVAMRNAGKHVRFQSPSAALIKAFETLGLATYLST